MLIDRVKWNNIPKNAVIMIFYALMFAKLRDTWKVVRNQIWRHRRTFFHPPRFVTGNRMLDVTIHMRLRHQMKISLHQGIHDTINSVTYLLTYLLTPWCRVLLEKLTVLQLVKKFPAFHGTPRFITALTSVRHLGQPNPAHILTSHLLEIYPNIIHPSTPRSPQWSLSLRFPH